MLSSSSYHRWCFCIRSSYQETQMIHFVACLFRYETRNHVETTKAVANQLGIMLSALVVLVAVQKKCNLDYE